MAQRRFILNSVYDNCIDLRSCWINNIAKRSKPAFGSGLDSLRVISSVILPHSFIVSNNSCQICRRVRIFTFRHGTVDQILFWQHCQRFRPGHVVPSCLQGTICWERPTRSTISRAQINANITRSSRISKHACIISSGRHRNQFRKLEIPKMKVTRSYNRKFIAQWRVQIPYKIR